VYYINLTNSILLHELNKQYYVTVSVVWTTGWAYLCIDGTSLPNKWYMCFISIFRYNEFYTSTNIKKVMSV